MFDWNFQNPIFKKCINPFHKYVKRFICFINDAKWVPYICRKEKIARNMGFHKDKLHASCLSFTRCKYYP